MWIHRLTIIGRLGTSTTLTFGVNREPMDGFFSSGAVSDVDVVGCNGVVVVGVKVVIVDGMGCCSVIVVVVASFPLTRFSFTVVSEDKTTGNNACLDSSETKLAAMGCLTATTSDGGGGGGGGGDISSGGMSHCGCYRINQGIHGQTMVNDRSGVHINTNRGGISMHMHNREKSTYSCSSRGSMYIIGLLCISVKS